MDITALLQRVCIVAMPRLVMVISLAIIVGVLLQSSSLPYYGRRWPLSSVEKGSIVMLVRNASFSSNFRLRPIIVSNDMVNHTRLFDLDDDIGGENHAEDTDLERDFSSDENEHRVFTKKKGLITLGNGVGVARDDGVMSVALREISAKTSENLDAESGISTLFFPANATSGEVTRMAERRSKSTVSMTINRQETQATSISEMNSLLLQSLVSSHHMRPQRSLARDRELLSAKLKIENAPTIRRLPGLEASAFRNISKFKRSYELMERILKVYIYKEGEKPLFHQSKMRGIYASEGWFMKNMEENRKFLVRNPRQAHLFFLPISPYSLRTSLFGQKLLSQKDLEGYLKNYVDLIARKYGFWNRTRGADHFLVGCHDWASRITRQHMRKCIRVLCNANVAQGFKIGKDTTLPVTYIRSAENPMKDVGGKPNSERSILAFFAGGMHGYLRSILVQFWENKEPDMKIIGPMPRDIEGKRLYREYMKSSKYCICARGYEVHTPRIVEAIFYECVPVIIADNYVPPFFEVLNWEAFSVFVRERDIPNLRNILVSIPEKKYLEMQSRVKMVQQHFLWHKKPVKYDLFHMILHSVWHNRIFQAWQENSDG